MLNTKLINKGQQMEEFQVILTSRYDSLLNDFINNL